MTLTVGLVGNPNCGKTTLFNALTGARQRVGNWPGVTVERKTGRFNLVEPCTHQQHDFELVDLPGLYSLTSSRDTAIDQQIACDFILSNQADVWVNIVDAAHLERHLYLSTQLLEMGLPLMIVVNMLDVAHKNKCQLDLNTLSQQLGCPVVGMSAHKQLGMDQFEAKLIALAQNTATPTPLQMHLPKVIVDACETLQPELAEHAAEYAVHTHWLALRLLESDTTISKHLPECCVTHATKLAHEIEEALDEECDIVLADARYTLAHQMNLACLTQQGSGKDTVSARLDKVFLNRILGLPCFLLVMYTMFLFSVNLGHAFQDFFDMSSQALFVDGLANLLHQWHAPNWLIAILAAGAGKGVNTTLTFIPIIGSMFLCLSFLEGSGYMARAAFVIDKVLAKIGLPGKSFVPLIVGFGCNVPAIMGARTLNSPRDRTLTVMMTPFMSCSARLAIYAVFSAAFFARGGATMVFALYLIGILMAVLTGLLLNKTLLRGESSPMIMELPPYHLPTGRALMLQTWHRLKGFVIRAGKLIVPLCILIGALNAINIDGSLHQYRPNQSTVLAKFGQALTPAFAPIGLQANNWPATVGLLTGVLAKETVIATLNTLYTEVGHLHHHTMHTQFSLGKALKEAWQSVPENLKALRQSFVNPISAAADPETVNKGVFGEMYKRFDGQIGAFAYLLFVLLYFPCVSTMAAIAREINARWMWFSIGWTTLVAYTCATLFYQLARLPVHPASSIGWSLAVSSVMLTTLYAMHQYSLTPPPKPEVIA